jgi:predicted Zn-dependent protease
MDLENKQIPIDLRALEQNVPDKLHPVLDFLVNNLRQIAWGVAGIVLLVAVYGVISHMRKSGEEKAQDELGLIVVQKVGAERLKALEAYVKTAPDALKAKANLELARIAMDEKAYDQAQAAWKALEGLGDPNLVFTARLGQAKCLMLAGKNKEAVAALTDLSTKAPKDAKRVVTAQLASAAEAAQDWPTAVKAYQELAGSAANDQDKPYLDAKVEQLKSRL